MTNTAAATHSAGSVQAPPGYEALTQWRDRPHGAGSWEVVYRRLGDTWWTVAWSDCGHAHSTDDFVREVAVERVRTHILINQG